MKVTEVESLANLPKTNESRSGDSCLVSQLTVVSDTSPLRYLIAVGRADLLDAIFHHVLIPLASSLKPDWSRRFDLGEAEAIRLATELKADFLLMDERRGRHIAGGRGVAVAGAFA